ncbi:MAG: FMN-binding protein, partial [Eubacterium sp.]|nr:FMN-binding protein [Eubacterium sp.]
ILLDKLIGVSSAQDIQAVDSVSGATLSSQGIKEAVSDALARASDEITGAGTKQDPYVISTAGQLLNFAGKVDEGDEAYVSSYVVLGADIDLSAAGNWNPIGEEGKEAVSSNKVFAGSFNGRFHTITGMKIEGQFDTEANLGLFSTLAGTARISNLNIKDSEINVSSTADKVRIRAGLLAGDTAGTSAGRAVVVDGCQVDGQVVVRSSSGSFSGGVLGRAFTRSAIINCISDGKVEAETSGSLNAAYAGGIAGMTGNETVIANCAAFAMTAAGNTSENQDAYAGGIAGMLSSKTYNVYAAGSVSVSQKDEAETAYAGIIAGQAAGSSSGDMICYASDASLRVNDKEAEPAACGENLGTIEEASFLARPASDLADETYAEELNTNIKSINDKLNEPELALREWKLEEGKVILSEHVWQTGEVDSQIFEGGCGTQSDPWQIRTEAQLRAFAGSLNSKIDYSGSYVKLMDDIDISGSDWTPVGGSFYRFDGDFDGNGMTISGLREGSQESPVELDGANAYIGLFGWINEHAHIHDLTLADVAIYTHSTGSAYLGGIAGRMSGTDTEGDYHGAAIDGCAVRGAISHVTDKGTSFMGGMVGHMFKGTIINSMTDVTMTGRELSGELAEVGGMVGLLNRGLVANSYALGDLTGSGYRDTAYDIEGMACLGNIAAVNGGYIVNCYGQGGVEALEYSIDTGIITGWVTGIAKVYNCWYNEDARMVIDGHTVSPVDPFGETVAGGVSDEWGFKFPGSLVDNNEGYHPVADAEKVAEGLNTSFAGFSIDISGIYGLPADALRAWTVDGGQAVLTNERMNATYVQPDIEKQLEEGGDEGETDETLPDGEWYGRSDDRSTVVMITVADGKCSETKVLKGSQEGSAYEEALARAEYKAAYGDTSDYDPADKSKFKGSGSSQDPYLIENEYQLRYLADSINEDVDWKGSYFRQTADITISGGDWKPIGWGIFADVDGDGFGQDVAALYPFRGNYDGGNHSIKGMRAGSESQPAAAHYMGMFGIVQGDYEGNEIPENGYRAGIRNVVLKDISFYTRNRWRSYVGGLVGNAQGGFDIDRCSVSGIVSSRSDEDFAFAGGLSGSLMYGSVENCMTDVDSRSWSGKSYSYAAGLSATTNRATIVNSCTLGDVHADADQTNRAEAGGFIGLDGGACINCYARGNVEIVSKYSMYIGGFVGMAASSSEHRQCYFNSDAIQKVAGKAAEQTRYAGKFVNESAEANSQSQTRAVMSSEAFVKMLEENRSKIATTLAEVRTALGADESGSSRYHSLYYNGDGSGLCSWALKNGVVSLVYGESDKKDIEDPGQTGDNPDKGDDTTKDGQETLADKKAVSDKSGKTKAITVNVRTVNAASIDKAVKKAGADKTYITKIVLGKKVKKISRSAFSSCKKVKVVVIKTKKLKKASVKGALKKSKITKIQVRVGKKSVNNAYVKKYKKIFTRKNAGRKVKVTR